MELNYLKEFESFDSNEHLFEEFPAILNTLDKNKKTELSQWYNIGTDSTVTEIPVGDAAKKTYADKLLVYVGSDGKPFAYGKNTDVRPIEWSRRDSAISRRAAIERASKVYLVEEDPNVRTKRKERSDAKYDSQEMGTRKGFGDRSVKLIEAHEDKLLSKLRDLKEEYIKIRHTVTM